MRVPLFVAGALLACAGCTPVTNPTPMASTPNGDVTKRAVSVAPDTPANRPPKPGFRDNPIDTDPSSPRTRDTGQKIEVPTMTTGE